MDSLEPHREQPRLCRAENVIHRMITNEQGGRSNARDLLQLTPKVWTDSQVHDLRGLSKY